MHDHDDRYGPRILYADLKFANEIDPDPVDWLWPARIPLAKLSLLIGDPGVGKSLLATDIAARVSTGTPWPDAASCLRASVPSCLSSNPAPHPSHRGGVILHAPEDAPEDTLIPRLKAAGADLESICILKGVTPHYNPTNRPNPTDLLDAAAPSASCLRASVPSSLLLPTHTPVLQQAVRALTFPRLLILDPLHAVIEPAAQSGSAALAMALADLAFTARSYNIAILAVCHLTKAHTRRLLYRIRGSLSLIAAARAAHILTQDPDQPDRRILTPIKTVYGPPPQPLTFTITHTSRLDWQDTAAAGCGTGFQPVRTFPLDLLENAPDSHSAIIEACDWLSDALARGPRPATELLREARSIGHSLITLRRAKRLLAVRSVRPTLDDAWAWTTQRPDNEDDHVGGARK